MEYLISSLLGGGGGLLTGMLGKGSNFGPIGNVIAGAIGGNAGGLLSGILGGATTGMATGGDWKSMLLSVVGGAVVTWISSFIKKAS